MNKKGSALPLLALDVSRTTCVVIERWMSIRMTTGQSERIGREVPRVDVTIGRVHLLVCVAHAISSSHFSAKGRLSFCAPISDF